MLALTDKSLIFGDLHLGIQNDSISKLNLMIKCIEEILKISKKENVKNIIFLGDWFDNRTYIHTITLSISHMLLKLLSKKHKVIIIAGNHDLENNNYNDISSIRTFSGLKNVEVVFKKPKSFILNNKKCLAVPWLSNTEKIKDEQFESIFGHFTVSGQKIRYNKVVGDITDNSSYVENKINDVREFAKLLNKNGLLFSGHIHNRTEHNYRTNRVVFVGSPLEQNFGEIHEKHGVYILDKNFNVKFHEIDSLPKHKHLRYSECFDENGKIKKSEFFKNFENNIVKKIIDVELDAEKQLELNSKLSSIKVYDYVESEILYKTLNNINSINSENITVDENKRLGLSEYIDLVFTSLDNDVFKTAKTNKDKLKNRFLEEYSHIEFDI